MSRFRGQNVVLTGASGFIGGAILRQLQMEGCARLVTIGRSPMAIPGVIHLQADLCELTSRHFQDLQLSQIHTVFHLAAGGIPRSITAPVDATRTYRDNLLALERLISAVPMINAFVFASTLDVYAPASGVLTEESPVAPGNLYSASKVLGEEMLRNAGFASGFRTTVLRYGQIYGPGEEAYRKLIPETIRALKSARTPVIFGEGAELRDFLFVTDAVEATIRAAFDPRDAFATINVARGQSVSVREVVEILCSFSPGVAPAFAAATGVSRSLQVDARRLQELMANWNFVSLQSGLQKEWDSWTVTGASA